MRVYSMAHCVCLFNIRSIELSSIYIYPAPVYLNMVMVLFKSLQSVHDLGVGGRHLAMSLYKLKASVTYLNNREVEDSLMFIMKQYTI